MIFYGDGPPPMTGAAVGQIVVCVGADGTGSGWIWNGEAWMFSYGAVRRARFPALYAAIGTTYGEGGDGEFVLPDLRSVTPINHDPDRENDR